MSYKGIRGRYEKLKTNIFIIIQAPYQLSNPKHVYYRSFNKSNIVFNKKLRHYSLDLDTHNKHQNFIKKIFNKYNKKYKNLNIIYLDDLFCNEEKCLIGNEKYSFYSDKGHLSTKGANLTKNKFEEIIQKF